MPPERYFLNWQQPALQQAAALLTAAAPHRHFIDLQNTVVLLPGARAQRRLLENLLLAA